MCVCVWRVERMSSYCRRTAGWCLLIIRHITGRLAVPIVFFLSANYRQKKNDWFQSLWSCVFQTEKLTVLKIIVLIVSHTNAQFTTSCWWVSKRLTVFLRVLRPSTMFNHTDSNGHCGDGTLEVTVASLTQVSLELTLHLLVKILLYACIGAAMV